ncbi:hypothetical protein H0537_002827 [Salmonella enterica]|nr:hypothetical protein [Salmonella enterica]
MQGIFGDGEADRQRNPHAIALGLNYPPVPLVTIGVNQRMGQNCLQFNPLLILSVTRLIVLHSPLQQIAQQRKWLLLTVKISDANGKAAIKLSGGDVKVATVIEAINGSME